MKKIVLLVGLLAALKSYGQVHLVHLGSENGTNTVWVDAYTGVLSTNHNEWWHLLPLAEATASGLISSAAPGILSASAVTATNAANTRIAAATPGILSTATNAATTAASSAVTTANSYTDSMLSALLPILQQTGWVQNVWYTNVTTRMVYVSQSVSNLLTVLGKAGTELRIGTTNGATYYAASPQSSHPILGLALGLGNDGSCQGFVSPGGRWQFADLSSGGGNTSTLVPNTGQYVRF